MLLDEDRSRVWRGLMRLWSQNREPTSLLKTQLRAAVDATDDWVEANASAFNSALPTAARLQMTAGQKALLLAIVVLARYDIGALRRLMEVD